MYSTGLGMETPETPAVTGRLGASPRIFSSLKGSKRSRWPFPLVRRRSAIDSVELDEEPTDPDGMVYPWSRKVCL